MTTKSTNNKGKKSKAGLPRGEPRKLLSFLQPELKWTESTISQVCDTTGAVSTLNGIAQGTTMNTRIGQRVYMKRLTMNIKMEVTAATGADQYQRFLVVLDHQCNAAAAVITDVLTSATTTSLFNLSNAKRFSVIVDKEYHLNATAEPGSMRIFKVTIPMSAIVYFNTANNGNVTDIVTNSLLLLSLGSLAPGATAGRIAGITRVFYYDN